MDTAERTARIEAITLELTKCFSVCETAGEAQMGEKIYAMLAEIPYFRQHPEDLRRLPIEGDPWGRMSVLALLRGEKRPSNKTVVTIGHFDTVGISDYGALAPYANQPDVLREKLLTLELPANVREDLQSGRYLFGRGVFDMKSGDAVLIQLLEEWAEHVDALEGNIIFGAVCDEECNSRGMLRFVTELERMQCEEKLDYLAMLDTDCMTSEYEGDKNRYIYTGTVGKIMPTFYIVGKETHAGEAFNGLDPNLLAAALTQKIDMNPEFCDVESGEVTLPPVVLQLRDRKTEYSTQIAKTTVVFFNYATHCSEPNMILTRMADIAKACFDESIMSLNQRYKHFCELAGRPFVALPWKTRVITYQTLYHAVEKEMGDSLEQLVQKKCTELMLDTSLDTCERTTRLVEFVHSLWSDQNPVIIIYFTPPYYPHVCTDGMAGKGQKLLSAIEQAVAEEKSEYSIKLKKFFPCISDLSYSATSDNPAVLQAVAENTPAFGAIYGLPLEALSKLKIPVSMIGTYGYDAHKYTERLEKTYSFETMPNLLRRVINALLIEDDANVSSE